MGGVDISTPINCQVRGTLYVCITLRLYYHTHTLTGHYPKVWITFGIVSTLTNAPLSSKGDLAHRSGFVVLRLHGIRCCFVINCTPHVRLLPLAYATMTFEVGAHEGR